MNISSVVLRLLVAMHPAEADAAERFEPIANVIAEESAAAPVFEGVTGARDTALLLVAIGSHESGFRPEVGDCRVKGDRGLSVGYWQSHAGTSRFGHSAGELCGNERLQAHVALRALHAQRSRGVTGVLGLARGYASGSASVDSRAARELAAGYDRAVKRAETLELRQLYSWCPSTAAAPGGTRECVARLLWYDKKRLSITDQMFSANACNHWGRTNVASVTKRTFLAASLP